MRGAGGVAVIKNCATDEGGAVQWGGARQLGPWPGDSGGGCCGGVNRS